MSLVIDTEELLAVASGLETAAAAIEAERTLMAETEWLPPDAILHNSTTDIVLGSASVLVVRPSASLYATQLFMLAANLRTAVSLYETAEAVALIAIDAAVTAAQALALQALAQALAYLLFTPGGLSIVALLVGIGALAINLAQEILTFVHGRNGEDAPNISEELANLINWQDLIRFVVGIAGYLPLAGIPPALVPFITVSGARGTAAIAYLIAVQSGLLRPGTFSIVGHDATYAIGNGPNGGAVTTPSIGSLIGSIPPSGDGLPQVSVTTYGNGAGDAIYEISITGTSNQAFGTEGQPLDNQGNLATYAGSDAESVAAVLAAIEASGVPEGATIVLSGYSQGAMIAQAIAGSGLYDVEFMTTVGTPSRPEGMPDGLTVVEVQHPEDPIVGLQGPRPEDNDGAIVVTADPGIDKHDPNYGGPFDHHGLAAYQASADALATSDEPAVQAAQAELAALYEGYEQQSTQVITLERNAEAPPPIEMTQAGGGEQGGGTLGQGGGTLEEGGEAEGTIGGMADGTIGGSEFGRG
ncbi:MAG: hypothetical protein ACTH31_02835 [Pseudoclavibacter sp.]